MAMIVLPSRSLNVLTLLSSWTMIACGLCSRCAPTMRSGAPRLTASTMSSHEAMESSTRPVATFWMPYELGPPAMIVTSRPASL